MAKLRKFDGFQDDDEVETDNVRLLSENNDLEKQKQYFDLFQVHKRIN